MIGYLKGKVLTNLKIELDEKQKQFFIDEYIQSRLLFSKDFFETKEYEELIIEFIKNKSKKVKIA